MVQKLITALQENKVDLAAILMSDMEVKDVGMALVKSQESELDAAMDIGESEELSIKMNIFRNVEIEMRVGYVIDDEDGNYFDINVYFSNDSYDKIQPTIKFKKTEKKGIYFCGAGFNKLNPLAIIHDMMRQENI